MDKRYHIEHLQTYLDCPQKFLYQCYYGLRPSIYSSDKVLFYACVRQVLTWCLVTLQQEPMSWAILSNRWEIAWANVAGNNDVDQAETYFRDGLVILNKFLYGLNNKLQIIAVDARYEVGIGNVDPFVIDFDATLVRGRLNSQTEFLKETDYDILIFNTTTFSTWSTHYSREFDRVLVHAVSKTTPFFTKELRLRLVYFNIQSGSWQARELPVLEPSPVPSAARRGIRERVYYPRNGEHCKQCPFNKICSSDHSTKPKLDKRTQTAYNLQLQLENSEDVQINKTKVGRPPFNPRGDLLKLGDCLPRIDFDTGNIRYNIRERISSKGPEGLTR